MGVIHIVSKTYYTKTTLTCCKDKTGMESACITDVITGAGLKYTMNSVIVNNEMSTEILKLPYTRERRCKIFQSRNVNSMTLPFKLDTKKLTNFTKVNTNYCKDFGKG